MGEIANDMITGRCCSDCGSYFESEHGYPVLCEICWDESTTKERRGYSKSTINEL